MRSRSYRAGTARSSAKASRANARWPEGEGMMQDAVRASLNYSVDNGIPPDYYFYEPEEPVKPNPPGTDPHEMEIVNGWPRVEQFDADREGFVLRPFPAAFS